MNNIRIQTKGTIVINKKVELVFAFFANPSNDKIWRAEINQTTLDGELQQGVKVSEYSFLSKKAPNNLLELVCVQYEKNQIAIFETPSHAPFYEKSLRQVRAVSEHQTEITYILDFDKNIVKFALGFALPNFIISFKANNDLKKYLHQLKRNIENKLQLAFGKSK